MLMVDFLWDNDCTHCMARGGTSGSEVARSAPCKYLDRVFGFGCPPVSWPASFDAVNRFMYTALCVTFARSPSVVRAVIIQ